MFVDCVVEVDDFIQCASHQCNLLLALKKLYFRKCYDVTVREKKINLLYATAKHLHTNIAQLTHIVKSFAKNVSNNTLLKYFQTFFK